MCYVRWYVEYLVYWRHNVFVSFHHSSIERPFVFTLLANFHFFSVVCDFMFGKEYSTNHSLIDQTFDDVVFNQPID